jgi:hypothetical protein
LIKTYKGEKFKMENVLVEKWDDLLMAEKAPKISSKETMAQLLENEEQYIIKEASNAGDMAQYTPILVPAIRRIFPNLLANEIVGVQSMNSPTGYAYALRYAYDAGQTGSQTITSSRGQYGGAAGRTGNLVSSINSILVVATAAVTAQVGASASNGLTVGLVKGNAAILVGTAPVAPYATGVTVAMDGSNYTVAFCTNNEAGYNLIIPNYTGPVTTAAGEVMGGAGQPAIPSMKMSLERIAIEAMTRKLKSEYSVELAQDLKAVHGLDAEAELINILEYEITAELDRELINRINSVSTSTPTWSYAGYTTTATTGANLADGRWEAERFRTLYTRIMKEANQVALTTRRGTANFIIASSNVVTALETLSNFMYSSVPGDVKVTLGVAKVGTLDGRFSVYLDTFANTDYVTVGYKGSSQFDTGVIYCPYVPLMLQKVIDPNTFQPKIAFMTRDAIAENLFGAASYYRTFAVSFDGSSLGLSAGTGSSYAYPSGLYGTAV